jgi:hypothetical protein
MWIGPLQYSCPFCNARPGKPCIHPKGHRKGKTCKTHGHRYRRFKEAQVGKDAVIWVNPVETNRSRH